MKGFSETERKNFIKFMKDNEYKGLSTAFKEYAQISGRAKGSVRNYYYKTVNECKNNEKLRVKLGVSTTMFPNFIKEFQDSESRELLKIVLKGIGEGKSVRSTILKLSNNDSKLALRYQNKYRNLLKNQKDLVLAVASKIKGIDGEIVNPYKSAFKREEQKTIEYEIDSLIKSLYKNLREENETLKEKNRVLEKENDKLKEIFKKNIQDKNFTKEFFNKNGELIVI